MTARADGPPEMADRARAIVQHHVGGRIRKVEPLSGGLTNHVFRVRLSGRSLVVRLGEAGGKTEAFLKEQWVSGRAAGEGVPVAPILEVGSDVIDTPYMLMEEVQGTPGTAVIDRLPVYRRLGELASLLHRVETDGFGDTFDWSANTLSRCPTFADHLDRLGWEKRVAAMEGAGVIDAPRARALRRAVRETMDSEVAAVARLNHGDLRLKNLFVEGDAVSAVIDWEDATSAPPRIWDLAIALHDLGPDERQAFLQGYGLSPDETLELAPMWAALSAVLYAPHVEAAAAAEDSAALGWFRARLMGGFDLLRL